MQVVRDALVEPMTSHSLDVNKMEAGSMTSGMEVTSSVKQKVDYPSPRRSTDVKKYGG